jgi:hypothetical protein
MGNRAVITTAPAGEIGIGIYLHWNGGAESVQAFLDVCRQRGFRKPSPSESYSLARLCGVLHEFFGTHESTSLGIGLLQHLDCDNYDNGVYVIGGDWEIIGRHSEGSRPIGDPAALRQGQQYLGIVEKLTVNGG